MTSGRVSNRSFRRQSAAAASGEPTCGVMYILSTGCQWRYLPKDFPPRSTVHNYFVWWQCDRVLDRIHHALYVECRERAEREASPTAAIIDSQSVKSAEKGGPALIRTGSMPAS